MSRQRSFDHDEARRRYAAGETVAQLARHYGTTWTGMAYAVRPDVREKMKATVAAWQRSGVCPDCGGPMTRTSDSRHRSCRSCAAKRAATTVRDTTLLCLICRQWMPDEAFPHNRSEPQRRGRHKSCRSCLTAAKREWRERNKVPCSHGCGRMVDAKNRRHPDRPPQCHPCANANKQKAA